MYQNFNPDSADFFDDTTKRRRFTLALIVMSYNWLIHPKGCYQKFINGEIVLGNESLKRKMNKLYYEGILENKG